MSINAKVAEDKKRHPERFCQAPRCLWRTGGGYCPRHARTERRPITATDWIRNGFQFPRVRP